MLRRHSSLGVLKWTGTLATLLGLMYWRVTIPFSTVGGLCTSYLSRTIYVEVFEGVIRITTPSTGQPWARPVFNQGFNMRRVNIDTSHYGLVPVSRAQMGNFHYRYIPLWLPIAAIAIPTAGFWVAEARNRRLRRLGYVRAGYLERCSRGLAIAMSIPVFICSLVAIPYCMESLTNVSGIDLSTTQTGPAELLTPIIAMALCLGGSYLIARYAYSRLRWTRQFELTSGCLSCGYNLTGNVSGVCPECGSPVSIATTENTVSGSSENLTEPAVRHN